MCEDVLGSDHRPVYALLGIEVDRGVHGFVPKNYQKAQTCPAAYHHALSSSSSSIKPLPLDTQIAEPERLQQLRTVAVRRVAIELSAMAFDFTNPPTSAVGAREGGEGEGGAHWASQHVAEVVVIYPIISEDPLANFRRVWSIGSVRMYARLFACMFCLFLCNVCISLNSIYIQFFRNLPPSESPEGTVGIQSSIRRSRQLPVPGQAMRMEFVACRYFSEHAVIKFVGHDGKDLGQSVIQVCVYILLPSPTYL